MSHHQHEHCHDAGPVSQHDHHHPHHTHDASTEEDEEVLEQQALGKIIFALRQYGAAMEAEVRRWEHHYRGLPPRHRALLAHLPAKAAAARRAAAQNQLFIKALLLNFAGGDGDDEEQPPPEQAQQQAHGQQQQPPPPQPPQQQQEGDEGGDAAEERLGPPGMPDDLTTGALKAAAALEAAGTRCSPGDAEKVRYVLKNLVRDWAAEGAPERQQSYGRIVGELQARFAGWQGEAPPRVLVPGAGLGRLCVEAAAAGFETQGNEFSYFMLLTAAFMLNSSACVEQWTVHPWLHMTCNNQSDADQLRGVAVPDVVPGSVVPPGLLSMCAGDFAEVYARREFAATFDAVVTCFFIDTAHNVLTYLEVIHAVLRRGGLWIHLGPLLWHWADAGPSEVSVELCAEDVQGVAQLMGFEVLQQQLVDAAYMANTRSMYGTTYKASFWTMRKTERALPDNLTDLLQLLAAHKQQQRRQEEGQQQRQQQPE